MTSTTNMQQAARQRRASQRRPRQKGLRVVGFGTYDRVAHPRAGIILDGLIAHGDTVVEINHPLGFSTAERVAMLHSPRTLWRLPLRLFRCWLRLIAGRFRLGRSRRDAVIVGYLGHFDVVLARILFPRDVIVLDQLIFAADTARDRGEHGQLKVAILRSLDWISVRCADIVMVDTDEHKSLLNGSASARAIAVAVGAPQSWFVPPRGSEPASEQTANPALRVVFFGLFTPLQGTPTIAAAMRLLRDDSRIQLTMIGHGQDYQVCRELAHDCPNITWLEWVPPAELPAIVAEHDVCLGIFGNSDKALRVVPNKIYQGAAAGCALLTGDTVPQRRVLGTHAVYVRPSDANALADALAELAADQEQLWQLKTAARALARESFQPEAIVAALRVRLQELSQSRI